MPRQSFNQRRKTMTDFNAVERNRRVWNHLAESGSQFAKVASDEECAAPLKTLDSRGWLPPDITGWNVLCLAAGGGWQSILYASAGANVTVVDISDAMLDLDRREADRRGLTIEVIRASMDDLFELPGGTFDLVHQPVSTCYVEGLDRVYAEVSRVVKPGGLYISQHKTPTSLQITHMNRSDRYVVGLEYYQTGALPETDDKSYREEGTREYLHRWEELVGGLCRSGFVIEDLTEPCRADRRAAVGHYKYRGRFVAPYLRMKARRLFPVDVAGSPLWIPE